MLERDVTYAKQGMVHIERRGYQLDAVLRDWEHVVTVMNRGNIAVVVFARPDHCDRNRWAGWGAKHEFVGEETRRLGWVASNADAVSRRAATADRAERVREIIDGNGPVPSGLDPDCIAAARRIARRLAQHRNG